MTNCNCVYGAILLRHEFIVGSWKPFVENFLKQSGEPLNLTQMLEENESVSV